jgi:hypothetical protein
VKIRSLTLLGLTMVIAVPHSFGTQQETLRISRGLISSDSFRQFSAPTKQAYLTGVIDGMMLAPLFDAPRARMTRFERCLSTMTPDQVVATISQYLASDPRAKADPVYLSSFNAMSRRCP